MNYIEHLFINFKYQNKAKNFLNFYSELVKEINFLREKYHLQIKTIYIATNDFLFLNNQELISFLALLKQFISNDLIEFSIEIGYETLNQEQLAILKQFQVNRLVWKVRTFNKSFLTVLNQKFNHEKMMNLIKDSFALNFNNFSIDLENNIDSQTKEDIISDLKIAIALKSPHISYQSHNDFHDYQNRKVINEFLKKYNYQNYEFFSFALAKEYYSQQTLAYLTLKNWYGLGPEANSFLKLEQNFITIVNSDKIPWNRKRYNLTIKEYYQLLINQALMLQTGVNLIENPELKQQKFWSQIAILITKGYLQLENNYLKATNQGWDLLNDVLIDIINSV